MTNDITAEMALCLIDFLMTCNEGGNTYSPPDKDLCDWARSIITRVQQESET